MDLVQRRELIKEVQNCFTFNKLYYLERLTSFAFSSWIINDEFRTVIWKPLQYNEGDHPFAPNATGPPSLNADG